MVTARLLRLRHPLRFALDAGNLPGRVRHRQPAVAINADADLVLVAAVDRFHPTVADRADLNHLAGLSLRLVSVVEGIHSTQRQVVSTLLHLT